MEFFKYDTNDPRAEQYELLQSLMENWEDEIVEFKTASGQYSMHDFLLNEVSAPVDWSKISPTIFGGIFESTLNPETRRSGGMHYTSPENIHKVIDPLFLDSLKEEFFSIRDEVGITPRRRKNALKRFHEKICSLHFFENCTTSLIRVAAA